jgi:regulator of cell morphogenesis and NO signaling
MDETITIGEIVAENYRKAEVFKKFNIDFCCGGGRSLVETCKEFDVDIEKVKEALTEIDLKGEKREYDVENWTITRLIDHIEEKHHSYVKEAIPIVSEFANKVKSTHGENKPYVIQIADHFLGLASELTAHLQKEENILFPFLKEMEKAKSQDRSIQIPFGSVQNPIAAMMHEHENAGDELKEINRLTESFSPPADACATHLVLYGMLKDFETDLMMHIHLENNVLFPRAIALEKEMIK